MPNKIIGNTIANIVTKVWSILSLYLFVPLWVHYLGIEGYGVISLYSILMTIMHFADAGLTATLTREFARGDISEQYKRNLLRTIELIYLVIAVFLFVGIFAFSGFIVDTFLKSSLYSHEILCRCVQIMGLTISFNFMFSMYSGGLLGLQKQVLANVISMSYSISRSAIVIIPLLFFPTLQTFFLWQLLSITIALVVVRYFLLKSICKSGTTSSFRIDYLRHIWKFALGMMLMAVIAALNTQLDKLVTGNVLSLEDMGYYSLASTVGIAVISISQPFAIAIYPELTRLVSNSKEKMIEILHLFSFVISALSATVGVTLFLYIDQFTYLWTHNQDLVAAIHIPARLLIIGNILQSIQMPPYYLALANGHTRTNVKLGLTMLILTVPSIYYFTNRWGINGTAIPFVFINICATLYLSFTILGIFYDGTVKEWLKYTLLPLIVNSFICILFYSIVYFGDISNRYLSLLLGLLGGIMSIILSLNLLIRMNRNLLNRFPYRVIGLFIIS